MRFLKVALLMLDAIVMLCVGGFIGAMIVVPNERSFSNEIEINASADTVWDVINDPQNFTVWQPDLKRVDVVDESHWIEYPKDSPEPLTFTVVDGQRPSSLMLEYAMGDSFTGTWQGVLTPTENGVRLRTRDSYKADGELTKIFVAAFFNMDKFAKKWNDGLKDRAESYSRNY